MNTFGFISVVIGLSIEIFGAFILAAEAIGIERVRSWSETFNGARNTFESSDESGKNDIEESRKQRWNFILTLVVTLTVTCIVSYFSNLDDTTPHVLVCTIAPGSGIACAGGVAAAAVLLRIYFRKSANFLLFVASKTEILSCWCTWIRFTIAWLFFSARWNDTSICLSK
jgi:hypothetical protein